MSSIPVNEKFVARMLALENSVDDELRSERTLVASWQDAGKNLTRAHGNECGSFRYGMIAAECVFATANHSPIKEHPMARHHSIAVSFVHLPLRAHS